MNKKSTFNLNQIQIQTAFFAIISKKNVKEYKKIKIWNEAQNTSKNFDENDTNSILIDDQFRNNVNLISIQILVLLIILSVKISDQTKSTERSKNRKKWTLFKNYDFVRDEMSQSHIVLNDYFVLLIILNFKNEIRFYFWSANFLFKNLIDYKFFETERAIKVWNENCQKWKYVIINDVKFHDEKNATKYAKIVDIKNAFQFITSKKNADVQKNVINTENHELTKTRLQVLIQWWNRKKNEKIVKIIAIFFDFAIQIITKKQFEMKSASSKSIKKQKRVLKKNENDETISTEIKKKTNEKKNF